MANASPFDQLVGVTLSVYIAPVGSTVPAVNVTPAAPWVWLGRTDGGQKIKHAGGLTYFSDDDHTEDVAAVREKEALEITTSIVGLTLENLGRFLNSAAKVAAVGGPPATKKLPYKRAAYPTQYAMLLRSLIGSPYGSFPALGVVPKGVFDGEPEETFSKGGRASLEVTFHALADDTQAADDTMGWVIVQTA